MTQDKKDLIDNLKILYRKDTLMKGGIGSGIRGHETNKLDPYTYKNTTILVNNQHIKEKEALKSFERNKSTENSLNINKMDFTSDGFLKLHKQIFEGIYDHWSGNFRSVNISNGNAHFAPAQHLKASLDSEMFNVQQTLKNMDKLSDEEFKSKAVEHFCELLFIHPFRDGNGRACRKFLDLILDKKGIKKPIWLDAKDEEYMNASLIGAQGGNHKPMLQLINKLS